MSHLCWSYSALSFRCKLPSLTKLEIMPTNIQPAIIEIIFWFCRRGFSHWAMSRITGVSKGDIEKVRRRVRDTGSLIQGLCRHRLKSTSWKEDRVLLHIMMWNRFLPVSRIRSELLRRISRRIRRRLAVAAYRTRHLDAPAWVLIIATCDAFWSPELEPSPLLSCSICWWIQGRPLPLLSTCFFDETIH